MDAQEELVVLREIAHCLWVRGARLRANLADSLVLSPENWHVEAAQQRLDEWDTAADRYFDFALAYNSHFPLSAAHVSSVATKGSK